VNTARCPVLVGPAPTNTHSAAAAAAAAAASADGRPELLLFWSQPAMLRRAELLRWWCCLLVGSSRGQGCRAMVVRAPGRGCSSPTNWGSTVAGTAEALAACRPCSNKQRRWQTGGGSRDLGWSNCAGANPAFGGCHWHAAGHVDHANCLNVSRRA
jgi:hypothetical protein